MSKRRDRTERVMRRVCKLQSCQKVFYSERVRQYCHPNCYKEAARVRSYNRYTKMRAAYFNKQNPQQERRSLKK